MSLHAQEILDKNQWEQFILASGIPTSFFQSWNWGEFQKSMGQEIRRWGFFDGDTLIGSAEGIIIRAKRGKYLYVRNGPVLDWSNPATNDFVINFLKQEAKELGLWYVRISPLLAKDSQRAEYIVSKKFPVSPVHDVDALDTWILDITQSEDEILKNMRKTTRYEINKAQKLGVKIITSTNPDDIDLFYPIYEDTILRQQWHGYSKEYIRKQFTQFIGDDQAKLYLAQYQGVNIAASIFIYHADSSYYHYSGSLSDYRKIPGPALIQWENIKEAKRRGLKQYNFWGIAPENRTDHPWQGLSFFKTGFGGKAQRWLETRDIPVSPLYWLTNLYEKFDKRRKGY